MARLAADGAKVAFTYATSGEQAEVGAFVSYLAGPDAAYITGASLDIDGGFGA